MTMTKTKTMEIPTTTTTISGTKSSLAKQPSMSDFVVSFQLQRSFGFCFALLAFLLASPLGISAFVIAGTTTTRGIGRTNGNLNSNANKISLASTLSSISEKADEAENTSWIEKANVALGQRDLAAAEESLMMAVAEVNGAVMNNPTLLRAFEDLFRTKIQIAQDNTNNYDYDEYYDNNAANYQISKDRMGLASLLTDQSKYQEAADELDLAVQSLLAIVTPSQDQGELPASETTTAAAVTLDQASSLLFRTRAMVCDWQNKYQESGTNLAASTRRALEDPGSTVPAVHPFNALTWPSLSLRDATGVAHTYGMRAMESSSSSVATTTPMPPWTNIEERLPRRNVPFVRAITTAKAAPRVSSEDNDDYGFEQQQQQNQPPPQTNVVRVGYLSPDFTGKHPLAFLMQDVFRFHDANKFDIRLYSLGGEADHSPEVQKIIHGTNGNTNSNGISGRCWTTLEGSVPDMAHKILDDRLDVLIDLCGYTGTSLVAEVMACLRSMELQNEGENKIANTEGTSTINPVHVAYMGFPGSSGAPYIDYMIADDVVIPSQFRPWYTENILFMPHCYFVNSHKHILMNSDGTEHDSFQNGNSNNRNVDVGDNQNNAAMISLKREDYGLPHDPATFVFCCHSRPDKIDPQTFATWIRALKRTRAQGLALGRPDMANAVLWLLRSSDGSQRMEANLREFARTILGDGNGYDYDDVEATAIVFCDQAPRHEHLKRLALADLFLDTPSYNAHTVGCDCLSAGVPMLSLLRPLHETTANSNNSNSSNQKEDRNPFVVETEKLASRVGASLLRSAEGRKSSILSDQLVVSSMEEYEDRMVECALEKNQDAVSSVNPSFSSFREHLLKERETAPLWDTERWVRNLETGLNEMVDRKRNGAAEADIYVMDYSDLQRY